MPWQHKFRKMLGQVEMAQILSISDGMREILNCEEDGKTFHSHSNKGLVLYKESPVKYVDMAVRVKDSRKNEDDLKANPTILTSYLGQSKEVRIVGLIVKCVPRHKWGISGC